MSDRDEADLIGRLVAAIHGRFGGRALKTDYRVGAFGEMRTEITFHSVQLSIKGCLAELEELVRVTGFSVIESSSHPNLNEVRVRAALPKTRRKAPHRRGRLIDLG
jgi:hypothetical protein